jgi:hypothetical protein
MVVALPCRWEGDQVSWSTARRTPLRRGFKWYVVYTSGDDLYVQARSHIDAERRAYDVCPANLGVAYTEL